MKAVRCLLDNWSQIKDTSSLTYSENYLTIIGALQTSNRSRVTPLAKQPWTSMGVTTISALIHTSPYSSHLPFLCSLSLFLPLVRDKNSVLWFWKYVLRYLLGFCTVLLQFSKLDLAHATLVNNAIEDSTHTHKKIQSENAVYVPSLWISTLPFSQDLFCRADSFGKVILEKKLH